MRTFLGLILLAFTLLLLVSEIVALSDPAAITMTSDGDAFGPPEPWTAHARWFAIIALTGWASVRLLGGGILGRLVRGRGLTPAPVRR